MATSTKNICETDYGKRKVSSINVSVHRILRSSGCAWKRGGDTHKACFHIKHMMIYHKMFRIVQHFPTMSNTPAVLDVPYMFHMFFLDVLYRSHHFPMDFPKLFHHGPHHGPPLWRLSCSSARVAYPGHESKAWSWQLWRPWMEKCWVQPSSTMKHSDLSTKSDLQSDWKILNTH